MSNVSRCIYIDPTFAVALLLYIHRARVSPEVRQSHPLSTPMHTADIIKIKYTILPPLLALSFFFFVSLDYEGINKNFFATPRRIFLSYRAFTYPRWLTFLDFFFSPLLIILYTYIFFFIFFNKLFSLIINQYYITILIFLYATSEGLYMFKTCVVSVNRSTI